MSARFYPLVAEKTWAVHTPHRTACYSSMWRSALFLLGIHRPAAAAAELLDITLTRQWDGGLLGFVLEQSAFGQLIAELSPGMPADVDDSLLPGDVIIGADGLAEGLFDQASLHECRVLDTFPPGTELSSMWHRRGLFLSYRSVRLVIERTPPFEVASASAAVAGPLGEWQPVRLTMTREFGSYDLTVSSMAGEAAEAAEAGEVLRVVHGRRVLLSRIAVVGTLLELTVVTASPAEVRRGAEERGVPHAAQGRAAGAVASATAAEGAAEEAEEGVAAAEAEPSAGEPPGSATAARAAEAAGARLEAAAEAAGARLEAAAEVAGRAAPNKSFAAGETEAAAAAVAAAVAALREAQNGSRRPAPGVGPSSSLACTADDPAFFDQACTRYTPHSCFPP